MSFTSPPPAWYPDPTVPGLVRWWDGTAWTAHTAAGGPQVPTPAAVGPDGRPYASFWARVGGLVLDSLIIALPTYLTVFLVAREQFTRVIDVRGLTDAFDAYDRAAQTGATPDPPRFLDYVDFRALLFIAAIAVLAMLVIGGAYAIVLVGRYGQTLGQRAASIRVVDAGGAVPGYSRAARRWALIGTLQLLGAIPFVGSAASLLLDVNYLSMLWSDQKQCWHDKIGGTWVVKTRP